MLVVVHSLQYDEGGNSCPLQRTRERMLPVVTATILLHGLSDN